MIVHPIGFPIPTDNVYLAGDILEYVCNGALIPTTTNNECFNAEGFGLWEFSTTEILPDCGKLSVLILIALWILLSVTVLFHLL